MDFCPACGNLLLVEHAAVGRSLRFFCPTCPYVFPIDRKISNKLQLKQKEVDDVLGGEEAWKNVDRTEEEDPDDKEEDDVLDIDSQPIENLDGEDDPLGDLPDPLPRIDIAEELWDHVDDHTCETQTLLLATLVRGRDIGLVQWPYNRAAGQEAASDDGFGERLFFGEVFIALQHQQAMTQEREFYDSSSSHADMHPPSVRPPMSTMSPTGSTVLSWSSFGAPYFQPSLPISQPMPYPYIPYRPPPHSMPLARPLFPSTSAPPLASSTPPPPGFYHLAPRYPPP
ncbi:hypothetical protein L7F22_054807 [Adiantum nelumboides]|nr:hypothetical protein [Adiantum nelumboides]